MMDKPEVVVRIVSNAYDADQVESDLLRISKNGTVELEDESGQFSFTEDMVRDLARDWSRFQGLQRKNSRYTTNIVLSMPAGTDPQALKRASQAFAKRQFGQNYQYAMALHTDTDNPHVQLTVRNLGNDGRRLHVAKGDPQKWREVFADELERCGVEAKATLKATRRRKDG
ncbi:relaxase/mobilization nuclease domain-containing protein [Halomonas caseinilytica]|nr:relaxase/mobilization nuclease domain-containing protein [Halomonas caseinilytica]